MNLGRFWRHAVMTPMRARRLFPEAAMRAIGAEISAQEAMHRGEIVFVAEAELHTVDLWRGLTPRHRARQVFAQHGVWNTEENNGVLVYVLLADRAVEIVADRGIDSRVGGGEWSSICRAIEREFSQGRYTDGAIAGVRAVSGLLSKHFPASGPRRNELPDRPILI